MSSCNPLWLSTKYKPLSNNKVVYSETEKSLDITEQVWDVRLSIKYETSSQSTVSIPDMQSTYLALRQGSNFFRIKSCIKSQASPNNSISIDRIFSSIVSDQLPDHDIIFNYAALLVLSFSFKFYFVAENLILRLEKVPKYCSVQVLSYTHNSYSQGWNILEHSRTQQT